jgi:leucyl-tRNA synthetase
MIHEKYDPRTIEGKWQEKWEKAKAFLAPDPSPGKSGEKPKYYCLCMFPYPSGAIHMGHLRNYVIGDVISRFKRMQGYNVMHPVGWDAFGLPAENAAIKNKIHPQKWTMENIAQMKIDLKTMGISYDWSREIATCLPEYYRWEQWLFRKFFESGLAYKKTGTVNWCPTCETVLANEQVQDGICWRCSSPVVQKELNQWYLKITAYAEQLLEGHKQLEGHWPARVLEMQKNWIGKSEGARIQFDLKNRTDSIEVFTTRPDTLFGVTFVTLAAGHPLAAELCTTAKTKSDVEALRLEVQNRPRDQEATSKKGFFTGSYCVHPLTGQDVPIWIGDFVVMDYGTGAVMAVPAHDQRDFEFASVYGLPITRVIVGDGGATPLEAAYTGPGKLVSSAGFTGLDNESAKTKIGEALEKEKKGARTIQYRLRDWGISRQRFWGAPVPVIYCEKDGVVLVPEKDLPVKLPMDVDFTGKQGNPLDHHPTFSKTTCPKCGGPARRETDTMDTFVESSWYYLRYADPHNQNAPFSRELADYWTPVDFYIGGIEHACMHLLYSRFFHKVLRDWGYVGSDEPFSRLLSQGMVIKDGAKMSKSVGNVVPLDFMIETYGADTGRLFSLFAAPPEKDLEWNEKGVEGCARFLNRVWRLFYQFRDVMASPHPLPSHEGLNEKLIVIRRKTHWTIKKMFDDLESQKFNTAISAAMELVNEIYALLTENPTAFTSPAGQSVLYEALSNLVVCLAPYAPHLSEELWSEMGKKTLVSLETWPSFDEKLLVNETFTLVVQVNGKVRDKVEVPKEISKTDIEKLVVKLPKIAPFIEGKAVRQIIYVPNRIANLVVT